MEETRLTGYPSIDKPWLKYYSEEAINAPLPECTAYELLYRNNKDHLNDIALNYYDRKITYKELFDEIEKAAKGFVACGVQAGDVVILSSVNSPEIVYSFYALNRLGAVANMVDPRTSEDDIYLYIRDSFAKVVVALEAVCPLMYRAGCRANISKVISISPAYSLTPVKKLFYRARNKSPNLSSEIITWKEFVYAGETIKAKYAEYTRAERCVIAHTGGTTGTPKGVILSNDNLNAIVHGYRFTGIPFERKQKFFADLPPFIMYGLCIGIHAALCSGLEVILYPIFSPKDFPKQFKKYKPNHFADGADHIRYLSESSLTKKMDLSFLITAAVGGDGLSIELEKKVNQFLLEHGCKFEVVKGYGMSECAATAFTTFKSANELGSVGIPMVKNNVKIVDTDSGLELFYDEIGEIWISSPSMMLGYMNNPDETSKLIIRGEEGEIWARTGDLGCISNGGLLFHKGRIRRIYLSSVGDQPAKIFPLLVEEKLRESINITDCCVVGRPIGDSTYNEAVAFIVKCSQKSDESLIEELKDICRKSVPTYMAPVKYAFLDNLPLTPIGKVDYRALEELAKNIGK